MRSSRTPTQGGRIERTAAGRSSRPLVVRRLADLEYLPEEEQAFVVGAFIAGGFLVGIWGLIDGAVGGGVSAGGVLRVDGPFPHPNAYAMYLLRPVVFAVGYLVVTRTNRPLPWIACGIGGASLVASFSRSAALQG
ncbi:MAG: hypothetical protein R2849_22000 [Thermomicrobiales bacterium]